MPDLDRANLLNSSHIALPAHNSYPQFKPVSDSKMTLTILLNPEQVLGSEIDVNPIELTDFIDDKEPEAVKKSDDTNPCTMGPKSAEHIEDSRLRKIEFGVPEFKCSSPFLVGALPLVHCGVCYDVTYPEEKLLCSVRGCRGVFHLSCCRRNVGFSSSKPFKCPQHACFLCKQRNHLWRCIRCPIASHDKCAPFPEHVLHFPNRPGEAICWRHPSYWCLDKHEVPAKNIEEIFSRLPLPYKTEEFKIHINWKDCKDSKLEPPSYTHIKRNMYLFKRKRKFVAADTGCTTCSSTQCFEDCVCRVQSISCSKACHCSKKCTNRPFRKEKRIQIVKTGLCGWGIVAAEAIRKGEFVVEYVGEVIDDAMCEERLWDMKDRDAKNFYMCEISKDFVIDATFKGNSSRFLNHSCAPNCILEKWQVAGETRVGVFTSRSIQAGEPLTYDYRFVLFGPEVECHCGAPNCRGYLGIKRKLILEVSWGRKGCRSSRSLRIIDSETG